MRRLGGKFCPSSCEGRPRAFAQFHTLFRAFSRHNFLLDAQELGTGRGWSLTMNQYYLAFCAPAGHMSLTQWLWRLEVPITSIAGPAASWILRQTGTSGAPREQR